MSKAKASGQKPIAPATLAVLIGEPIEQVSLTLDAMYESTPPPVNRALITKGGETYYTYWPTGVVTQFSYGRLPDIIPKAPAPRRDEVLPEFSDITKEGLTTKMILSACFQHVKNDDLKIVEFIFDNPGCNGTQIHAMVKPKTIHSNINWYVTRGHIEKSYLNARLCTYKILGNWQSGRELYYFKKAECHKKNTIKGKALGAKLEVKILEKHKKSQQDFSAAYTSNGTLLLRGLPKGDVELDHEKTIKLYDFINASVNIE